MALPPYPRAKPLNLQSRKGAPPVPGTRNGTRYRYLLAWNVRNCREDAKGAYDLLRSGNFHAVRFVDGIVRRLPLLLSAGGAALLQYFSLARHQAGF